MGHDYTELMSAALDGQLEPHERAAWNEHLANCPRCQERWEALCAMHRLFAGATLAAPPPDLTQRVAQRLARSEALQPLPSRLFAGIGLLASGLLGLLVLMSWSLFGTSLAFPLLLGNAFRALAQWWIFIRAITQTVRSLIHLIPPWGAAAALAYTFLLVVLAAVWWGMVWQVTGCQSSRLAIPGRS